ncbi:branched-chain amino acid transaminase [Candidatus Gracilibacteria bacterium]|nr:branched-chain amino acid transaminase [Candidatus Gracilibacteria bacterium]
MAISKTFPFAYIRKKVCKIEDAVVPIQAKAIQYGLGCFSGIRGFWNEKQKNLYLFRLEDHFKRFQESAKITGMQLEMDYKKFEKIIMELLMKNKVKGDVYIRPVLYSGSTQLTPRFDNEDDDVAIYMISLQEYFKEGTGLNVCISSWRRFDDDVFSVKAKMTGAYASSALAKTDAIKNGYDEPIFLNRDGKVCEASGANIFGVKDGVVWTPPLSSNILNGITRRSLIEICKYLDIEVREENFDRSMFYAFDEAFLSGTAAKVTPIYSVDHRTIGSGKEGPISKKISELYSKAAYNDMKEFSKWCKPVY